MYIAACPHLNIFTFNSQNRYIMGMKNIIIQFPITQNDLNLNIKPKFSTSKLLVDFV